MVYILVILTIAFVAVVFFLAKVAVLQMEQACDEDVLRSKETYQKIIDRQAKTLAEKTGLEREAAQIFTLYEMTKEINRHFNEQEAFSIFKRRLRENITIEDCQLVDEAPPDGPEVFVLKAKEKKLGFLVTKGVPPKDKEKFAILAHQFALAYRRIKLYKDIEILAITDGLTAVSTRRYFLERFDEEIKRAQARKIKTSFLMLDVDHFKMINDRHGHLTGDAVLKEIGVIIKENIRESTLPAVTAGRNSALSCRTPTRRGPGSWPNVSARPPKRGSSGPMTLPSASPSASAFPPIPPTENFPRRSSTRPTGRCTAPNPRAATVWWRSACTILPILLPDI